MKNLFLIVSICVCRGLIRDEYDVEDPHQYLSFDNRGSISENLRTASFASSSDDDSFESMEDLERRQLGVPLLQRYRFATAAIIAIVLFLVVLIIVSLAKNI